MAVVQSGWMGGCGGGRMGGCGGGRVGGCFGGRVGGCGGGRVGGCFGGGRVAVVRKEEFTQCTATIYLAAALFFKQIVEKLIFFVMRINSLRQLGILPPICVASS